PARVAVVVFLAALLARVEVERVAGRVRPGRLEVPLVQPAQVARAPLLDLAGRGGAGVLAQQGVGLGDQRGKVDARFDLVQPAQVRAGPLLAFGVVVRLSRARSRPHSASPSYSGKSAWKRRNCPQTSSASASGSSAR